MKTEVHFLAAGVRKLLGWVGLGDANHKMRENAGNWLELAQKVYHFRRDVLTSSQLAELQSQRATVQGLLDSHAGAEKLKLGIERLEEVLQRTGGAIYPKSALVENVEFFLVAAIVILGIRTYFVQPFKIPTNSMWPTYNGMTPQTFIRPADEPGALMQVVRFAAFGARPRRVDAPASGEVLIPIFGTGSRVQIPFRQVPGRSWFIFATTFKEYELVVGEQTVTLQVPQDFDFEWAVRDAFFPGDTPPREPGGVTLARVLARQIAPGLNTGRNLLHTGKQVKAGERVLAFDILTGDQLFVDRVSYHFFRPSVGQGFVFRTDNIHSRYMIDPSTQEQVKQYYIKRLVGTPGDTLEVREPGIIRNGQPIAGANAFTANAQRSGQYGGYFNFTLDPEDGYLKPGEKITVPPRKFFAMGDNSANSQDGRYWGFVPAKDVVGRPLFVYFPFTRHWGPAR